MLAQRYQFSLFVCLLLILGHIQAFADTVQTPQANECVILLHGLARTRYSLEKIEEAMQNAGFFTVNLGYPSRDKSVELLAEDVISRSLVQCGQTRLVHFLTHSLGGILVRYYLGRQPLANLGRVVMLSPPNQGSEVVDELKDQTFYQWFNGPAGQQLITGPEGLPVSLGPVNYPVGIITGNRHAFFDRWFAQMIPGVDDGKVSVERAKLEGMHDFLVVPYTHPFIMDADEVIEQSLHFLRHGRFQRMDDTESSR